MSDPAIFFDRDGTLNEDIGFVHDKEQFVWLPGAIDAIRKVNERGFLAIVVTNQSGVARGYYPIGDVDALHGWMNEELARHGAHIDKFYFCPHHPEGAVPAYRQICCCRKPQPGMIKQACIDLDIDLARSYLVGDRQSDMDTAVAAGLRGILYQGGNLLSVLRKNISELCWG